MTAEAFRAEIDRFALAEVSLDVDALARARAAVSRSGLLLLGEPHGAAETPNVIYTLMRALELRGLGFEWSHEELGQVVEEFVATGELDLERLWHERPEEFFCGDGRVTAGHFALLERLRGEGRLDQVVLFDRLDPGTKERDTEMAERLLREWSREVPLLAVAGAAHVRLDRDSSMAALVRASGVPLATAAIEYEAGELWFHGVRLVDRTTVSAEIAFAAGRPTPAVVPSRSPARGG